MSGVKAFLRMHMQVRPRRIARIVDEAKDLAFTHLIPGFYQNTPLLQMSKVYRRP